MTIEDIEQEVREKFYSFFEKLELTKKNNSNNKDENKSKIINEIIIDIDNYKEKLGFYKHVQLSDKDREQLLKLFNKNRAIYKVNYGFLFHFICWYTYHRLISFKKFEKIGIDPTNSKFHNITTEVAGNNRIYKFIFDFIKKMIEEKNSNLLDFCREILPIIFVVWKFILENKNYEFIELIKDESPDFYVLYKDKSNNKSYVWLIEIGGIYVEYKLDNQIQKFNYNAILNTVSKKLDKYDTYIKNSNEFISKDNINKRISNKLKNDCWEVKKPLIALFPINKRICKYELLQIIDELKTSCERNSQKNYNNVLNELNEDANNAKIRFFYFDSFYCDTIIFLLSKKTNFEKSNLAEILEIKFKNQTGYNNNNSIFLYQKSNEYSDKDKKLIEDVINVLKYDDNVLEGNKIKNIHCKNNDDIESIELF